MVLCSRVLGWCSQSVGRGVSSRVWGVVCSRGGEWSKSSRVWGCVAECGAWSSRVWGGE